jgi:hypothetical protein
MPRDPSARMRRPASGASSPLVPARVEAGCEVVMTALTAVRRARHRTAVSSSIG